MPFTSVLYGMKRKAWRTEVKAVKEISSAVSKKKYDGYTFYIEMNWDYLNGDQDSIGIDIPLTNGSGSDTTGFFWQYDLSSNTYQDYSYFYDGATGTTTND